MIFVVAFSSIGNTRKVELALHTKAESEMLSRSLAQSSYGRPSFFPALGCNCLSTFLARDRYDKFAVRGYESVGYDKLNSSAWQK